MVSKLKVRRGPGETESPHPPTLASPFPIFGFLNSFRINSSSFSRPACPFISQLSF